MTNVKQRKIIVTVSVIIAFALSLLMLTVFDPFKTTAAEITPETFSVEMAQVRQHITEDTQGGYLRFVVRVGNGVYDTYGIDNHTYGTLLLPEDRLGDNELTFDTAMVLDIPAVKWQLADDDYHTYTAVLKGAEGDDVIPESYYNRPIVARAYIKNNATGEVQYSEHLSRSIGYVATMNVATGSGNEILTGIANGTNKSVEFDKTTLVNNADSLIPNIVFGGVSVPEDQLSNLDITYSTNGDGVTSDDTNVIKPNGHGEATVTATLNIPGFESIETTEVTIASHELVDHDAIAASCDAKGTVAHWSCSACGKNYSDANAVNELASTSVAVLGHSYEEAYRMDATYTEKGWIFKACTRCKDEISILNGNMLGHSISQSTVTLIENTNVFGSALNEQGGTEFAIQGTSLDKATWQSVAALMTNTQRGYLADGTTTFYPSFFRFEIDVDFTKNETTSFKVGVSTISSNSTAPEIIFGGVPVKFAEANTWYDVVVYSDGSVYFNGTLVAGATLTGNSIVFEFDNNRTSTTSHNHYGTFYIGEAVEVVAETREYDLGLGDVTGEPISAIGGSALTFWTAPAVAEKTVSGVKQNVISQDIQVYKDGNDKVEWNYFRYTLEINYKQFESITIPVATNVITNGAFDIYVGGVKGVITTGNAWSYITVMKDGSVYFNGTLMEGALVNDYIIIELDSHRPSGTFYGQFYIGTPTFTIKGSASKWESLDIDLGANANGTKTDGNIGYEEDKLGITSVTEFTFAAWQHSAFATLDLTDYEMVKFYLYRPSENGGGAVYDQGNGGSDGGIIYLSDAEYVDTWVEIILKKSIYGDYYNLYVNGERQRFTLKSGEQLTNLKQLALNGSSGKIKYSDVKVVPIPVTEPVWESVGMDKYNIASSMTNGTKADGSVTDTEAALGITSVKEFTITSWGNQSFAELNLLSYDEVKFYIQGTSGSIRTNSDGGSTGVITTLNSSWQEIRLVKNSAGTGFDVYVNGTLSAIKFYTDSSKTTEIPLTNMKQFALNGSSGTVKFSNLMTPYVPPFEYEANENYNIASSMTNGTKTDGSVTDTETELGITFVKEFTITGWGNTSFAELNLLSYDEVKFYMQGTAGSIRTNSDGGLTGVIATLNNSWQEIRLVKNSAGTGFDVYVNGTLSTIKFYTDNKKTTEIPLTNMKQFALNGSSGTVKYSNIIVAYEGYYEEPEIEYDEEEVNDDYTIIFENGDTQVNYAAVELQAFFKEATGTLLFKEQYRGVNSLNGNIIVLGVLPATDKGFSFEGLGESDYVIKKDGSVIYIYGKTGYGVLNGVYALLGDLFELEIYYEDTYTLTKNEGFKITAEAVTEKTSSLTFDYIWSGLGELKPTEENGYSEDYAYQMGFATDYKITNTNVHNATTLLEEYRAAHPEWFYSEKGKNYGQIYLAAENFRTGEGTLVTTVAEKIFELLKEDTQYEREIALLFSAMDEDIWPHGTGYENSDALYNKYGTYAAENIMFMNAVAKELDRMIEAEPLGRTIQLDLLCYNKTLVAPELDGLSEADKAAIMMYKGTNISVIPLIAPVEGNRYLSFEDSRNKVKNPATGEIDSGSKTIAQVIEGWQALANGNDMHMWWYASDGFDFFVMMDTITNMQANYKFAAEHGITIMYNQSQGSNAVAPDWSRLKIYVQSQLQKDVNCDVDAVIDEWMDAYFGAGAGSMKTLLAAQKTWYASFFNAVFAENQGHYTAGGFSYSTDMAKWHFTENPSKPTFSFWDKTDDGMLDTWMGYIKEAKAAINADSNLTAEQKTELCNRVDLESLTIRYTLIEVFGTKTYDSSTSAFYQFAKSLGVTYSAEGKKIS